MDELNNLRKHAQNIMQNDPAHDFEHIMRVYKNASKLCKQEKIKSKIVLSAALLHDIVSHHKSDKRSKNSSLESAKKSKNYS